MPPLVATIICLLGIGGLFWLDRDRKTKASPALWIPFIWMSIVCTRSVSDWVNRSTAVATARDVMEGSPLDRAVFSGLLGIGILVLCNRRRVIRFLRSNKLLLFFYVYCLFSILWSDFPGVALRRWPKALGDIVMVLIVLSDLQPLSAFKRLLSRVSFVLIPVSILFIKYFPQLGMAWNPWTGGAEYCGVTENKNTLGVICLCLGLGALWRLNSALRDRKAAGRNRQMIAHGTILLMTIYLFMKMDSMTSLSCFVMASILLVVANLRIARRRPALVHAVLWVMVLGSVAVLFLGFSPGALKAIGRNPTLTERTVIWSQMLTQVRNPVFGAGFESFWLGPRLDAIWALNPVLRPNEAHNGYLEVYLNLGWIGIALLGAVLVSGYRTAFRAWRTGDPRGALLLSYFLTGLVYNCTEAAFFKMQAVAWLFFLFSIVSVPAMIVQNKRTAGERIQAAAPVAA